MTARDFPPGTTFTAREAAENDSIGIVEMQPFGWVVYVTQPDRSIAHYTPDDADRLADIYQQSELLTERIVPTLRQLAQECRAKAVKP